MGNKKMIQIDGQKLKRKIIASGHTQKTLSEKLGFCESSMCRYCQSGAIPIYANYSICAELGVPVDYFVPPTPEEEKAAEQKQEANSNFERLLEKLDFININICSLLDAVERLTDALK